MANDEQTQGETFELEVVTNVKKNTGPGLIVTKRKLTIKDGLIVGKGEPYQQKVEVVGSLS